MPRINSSGGGGARYFLDDEAAEGRYDDDDDDDDLSNAEGQDDVNEDTRRRDAKGRIIAAPSELGRDLEHEVRHHPPLLSMIIRLD